MQIADDKGAQRLDLVGRRYQVRHHDRHHAGGGSRSHAVVRILQRQAKRRRHAQPLGRLEEGIGRGLAAGIVAVRHHAVEAVRQPMRNQMAADRGMRGRRGDGPRQPQLVQQVEQLGRAGLQRQAGRGEHPEVPPPGGDQGLERIVRAIVLQQETVVHLAGPADQLEEHVAAHGASDLGGRRQDRLAVKRFGVEQQAVHVEDDRCRLPGKSHRRPTDARRSARAPARRSPRRSAPR